MSDAPFELPVFKLSELITNLGELGIKVKEQDIKQPKSAHIRSIYEAIVEEMIDMSFQDFRDQYQARLEDQDHFEHPELHTETLALMFADTALVEIMQGACIVDFSMADILRPEFKRTKKNLSALINFYCFWANQRNAYEQLAETRNVIMEEREALIAENDDLESQIQQAKDDRASVDAKVHDMRETVGSLEQELRVLNMKQCELQREAAVRKSRAAELNDDIAKINVSVEKEKIACRALKSKLVSSPRRVMQELGNRRNTLAQEKETLLKKEAKHQTMKGKADALTNVETKIKQAHGLLENAADQINVIKSCKMEIEDQRVLIAQKEKENGALSDAEQNLSFKHKLAVDRLNSLRKQLEMKRMSATQCVDTMKKERERFVQVKRRAEQKAVEYEEEHKLVQSQMDTMLQQHNSDMANARKQLSNLYSELEKYRASLRKHLQAATV